MALSAGEIIAVSVILGVLTIVTLVVCIFYRNTIAQEAADFNKRRKISNKEMWKRCRRRMKRLRRSVRKLIVRGEQEEDIHVDDYVPSKDIPNSHQVTTVENGVIDHSKIRPYSSNHSHINEHVNIEHEHARKTHYLSRKGSKESDPHSYRTNVGFPDFPSLEKLQVELNTGPFQERYVGDDNDEGGFLAAAGGSQRKPKALAESTQPPVPPLAKPKPKEVIPVKPKYVTLNKKADVVVAYVPGTHTDIPESITCHTFPRTDRIRRPGNKSQTSHTANSVPQKVRSQSVDTEVHDRCTCIIGDTKTHANANLQQTYSLRLERRPTKEGTYFGIINPSGNSSLASTPNAKKRKWDTIYHRETHSTAAANDEIIQNVHVPAYAMVYDQEQHAYAERIKPHHSSSNSVHRQSTQQSVYGENYTTGYNYEHPGTFPRSAGKSQHRPSFLSYDWDNSLRHTTTLAAHGLDNNRRHEKPYVSQDTFI